MRDKLISVSAVLGYGGSEVFPKQIELKSKDDTGNFLNLPYFNCKKQQDIALMKMVKLLIWNVFIYYIIYIKLLQIN